MKRKRSETDRAFLSGFAIGYTLGLAEARKEWATIGDEIEAQADAVRAEFAKTIREVREQWGLPPEPPTEGARPASRH